MSGQSIGIGPYFAILRRRTLVVIAPIILAVLVVVCATRWLPGLNMRVYQATSTVRLALAGRSAAGLQPVQTDEAQRISNTSSLILGDTASLSTVIGNLHLNMTPDQLASRISIKPIGGTELIAINARASSPQDAQAIANALAELWPKTAAALYDQVKSPDLANAFTVAEPAKLPTTPLGLGWPKRIALALLGGTFSGLFLALVFDYADHSINSIEDLRSLSEVTVLSSIARPKNLTLKATALSLHAGLDPLDSPDSRLLTVKLIQLLEEQQLGSLFITSATNDDNACDVAISIAVALARSGERVVLADADLATPRLQAAFDLPPDQPGLTDLLSSLGDKDAVLDNIVGSVLQSSPQAGLDVITAGSPVSQIWNLVGSQEMSHFIESFDRGDELLIVHGPPLSTADAFAVATHAGGVIIVCSEGHTSSEDLQHKMQQLRSLGCNITGCVYCHCGSVSAQVIADIAHVARRA